MRGNQLQETTLFRTALPAVLGWVLFCSAGLLPGADSRPTEEVRETKATIRLDKKSITVERFEPTAPGKYPAVILLHDSAGLGKPGPIIRTCCKVLAREGYVVLLPHYFDATGHRQVEPGEIKAKDFRAWEEVVRATVTYARGLPAVDRRRVGLVGFSLGAHLALAAAMRPDLKVACVAEFFGGLPNPLWVNLKRLPPTLVIHGDRDTIVSVKEAYALRGFCEAKGCRFQARIFEGQGHMFRAENFLTSAPIAEARRLTLAFLKRNLRDREAARAPEKGGHAPTPD